MGGITILYITYKIRISFKKHRRNKREKGFTNINSVTRLSSLCQPLTSTNFGSIVAMCLSATVVTRSSRPTTPSTDTRSLCVASLTTGRAFATSPCVARTTIDEIVQEEGRHPLPSQSGNILCWLKKKKTVFSRYWQTRAKAGAAL